jgi:hypothetical protein
MTPHRKKKLLLRNYRGGQDPHRVVEPVKKKKNVGGKGLRLVSIRDYLRLNKFQVKMFVTTPGSKLDET